LLLPWRYEKSEWFALRHSLAEFRSVADDLQRQLHDWQEQVKKR